MAGQSNEYDRKTLITAAVLLIGFGVLLYFLPTIMMTLGAESPWIAGAVVFIVLAFPFVGLWLRGRMRRRK